MKAGIIRAITLMAVISWLLPMAPYAQSINVWPGDVDNNGVVNGLDLIYLGRAYGLTGPVRTDTTNSVWAAQSGTAWNSVQPNSQNTNTAYADCNGDGIVDSLDQALIVQNYGLTHAVITGDTVYSMGTDTDPALYFASLQDTFTVGSQIELYLTIGTPSIPVDSFFGITFSIYYDTTLVQKNSVSAGFDSRLLDGDNILYMSNNFPDSGRLDVAISLKASNGSPLYAASGYGNISTLSYILENNIIGKGGVIAFPITASRIQLVDPNLNILRVNAITDTIYISPETVSIASINNVNHGNNVQVYPNPAKDRLNIVSDRDAIRQISIYDMVGREVLDAMPDKAGPSVLNVASVIPGLYMVKVTTDTGVSTRKILIE